MTQMEIPTRHHRRPYQTKWCSNCGQGNYDTRETCERCGSSLLRSDLSLLGAACLLFAAVLCLFPGCGGSGGGYVPLVEHAPDAGACRVICSARGECPPSMPGRCVAGCCERIP